MVTRDLPSFATKPVQATVVTSNDDVLYLPLGTEHIEGAAHCIASSFTTSEPMCRALGIAYEDFLPFSRLMAVKAAKEGLSQVVVRGSGTHRVVCASINEDFCAPLPEEAVVGFPHLSPILTLLNALDERYQTTSKPSLGEAFHVVVGGSLPGEEHKGHGKRVMEQGLSIARLHGFRRIVSHLSNAATQQVYVQRLGLAIVAEIVYRDFELDGARPFADIESPRSCIMVEGVLG